MPAQAVGAASQQSESEVRENGYRVAAVRWDPLLQQKWIAVSRCGHPEFPTIAILMTGPHDRTQLLRSEGNPAIVHVGDRVRLWKQEQTLHIELSGIAQENATIGRRVRVRVDCCSPHDLEQPQTLLGIVRGVHEVEIER